MSEIRTMGKRLLEGAKKYRYLLIVLMVGVGLLLLPESGGEEETPVETTQESRSDEAYVQNMEQRLKAMLSRIEGVGQVEVMLTLKTGANTHYQTDTQTTSDANASSSRTTQENKTVILSEGSAYDVAAVTTVSYPSFQGALVICQGAQRPGVQLQLISAVADLTGLSSDRITVVKMN